MISQLCASIAVSVALILPPNAPAADPRRTVNFAYSAPSPGAYTGYWIAREKGFFEKHGVVPGKVVYISGASIAPEQYVYSNALDNLERENFFTGLAATYGVTLPGR